MRTLLNIYNPSGGFWDLNPQFKTLTVFKTLYKEDKSRNKKKSSDLMWVISGVTDAQSDYHDMPDDLESVQGKYQTIGNDLMKSTRWWEEHIEQYDHLHVEYERIYLTKARRALRAWENKLNERQKVFDTTKYIIGLTNEDGKLVGSNVEILDKMFERTTKIWDQYFKIQEAIEGEGTGNGVKGGGQESGSDTGQI
jgi:hypothetical protein